MSAEHWLSIIVQPLRFFIDALIIRLKIGMAVLTIEWHSLNYS